VGIGDVQDVNVIAHAGAVGGGVVGAENFDVRNDAEGSVENLRNEVGFDAMGLAAYCEAVALMQTLAELVTRAGPLLIGRDGNAHKNPAVSQLRDASAAVRMWAREFGFTPAARQPLKVEIDHHGLSAERLLSS